LYNNILAIMAISDSLYCKFQLLQPQLTITAILIVTKFVYIYIYICVCVCVCVCVFVYVFVCICVCTQSLWYLGWTFMSALKSLCLPYPQHFFAFLFFLCVILVWNFGYFIFLYPGWPGQQFSYLCIPAWLEWQVCTTVPSHWLKYPGCPWTLFLLISSS
jgi:hypothetical protein